MSAVSPKMTSCPTNWSRKLKSPDRGDLPHCLLHPVQADGLSGTAFFFKQWGGFRAKTGGRELEGRTWDDMPTQISVRVLEPAP